MKAQSEVAGQKVLAHHSHRLKRFGLLALLCITVALSGCASIVSGTKQNVKITSMPDAADVKIERLLVNTNLVEWEGKTPAVVKLSRKESFLITVSLPGYQKAEIPVSAGSMNGWVWGNIFTGGFMGVLIDSFDGAAENLKPDKIDVKLVAIRAPQTGRRDDIYAVVYAGTRAGRALVGAYPLKPREQYQ